MSIVQIRFAISKDKEKILSLLDELGEEINLKKKYSAHNTEAKKLGGPIVDEILKRNDTKIFVAELNGKLVGLITFYVLPNIRHGSHRGHIEDIVVSKSMRGEGIGSKLFDSVKKYCRDNNINVIKLDSGRELIDAHKFYEKNGGKYTEKMFRFDIE